MGKTARRRGCRPAPLVFFLLGLSILCNTMLGITPARSHEMRPIIATAVFDEAGAFELILSLNLEALMAGIGPEHSDTSQSPNAAEYDRLRGLSPAELRSEFGNQAAHLLAGIGLSFDDKRVPLGTKHINVPEVGDTSLSRISEIVLRGVVPTGVAAMAWSLDATFGDSAIRARKVSTGEIFHSTYVQGGRTSGPIPLEAISPQNAWSVFANYVLVGFEHIVPKGLDHILFVIGLFLLSPQLKSLLWQVTSFTIAHSVTLALAMLGIVQLSPSIVEPLIALSIVYVAVENTLTDRLQTWRPLVVFLFGLLHGLGFAGVLSEIGVSPTHFVTGLIAFNLGVELGQLAVVAACFLAVGLWFRTKSWYRSAITVPASLAIAVIAAYWFVERVT